MTVTKPCATPGCGGVIALKADTRDGRRAFKRRDYCDECVTRHRVEAGRRRGLANSGRVAPKATAFVLGALPAGVHFEDDPRALTADAGPLRMLPGPAWVPGQSSAAGAAI